MADERPSTTSGAILNPRSVGTTGIGGMPPVEPPKAQRGGSGGADRAILLVFMVLVLAAAGYMLYRAEMAALSDPAQMALRGEVNGAAESSLTEPANFKRALGVIDASLPEGGYIETLRLAPDRINALIVEPSGLRRTLNLDAALGTTGTQAGSADGRGLDPQDIPADGPERVIEQAEKKYGLQPEDFDYMVAGPVVLLEPSWTAFWKQPLKDNALSARLDGSGIHRLGEPAP
jgi:hypothetical protein